jgi:hypothetical protein
MIRRCEVEMKKKILLFIVISLILIGGITTSDAVTQNPPTIQVSLAFVKSPLTGKVSYLLDPLEPIPMRLSLTNWGPVDILTSQGFSALPFHLLLTFIDPDGKGITSKDLESTTSGEPPPPPIIPVNIQGTIQLLQAEPVERLQGGQNPWTLVIDIPDAHAYYSLTKAGRYSVKAIIPMRTYPFPIDYSTPSGDYKQIDSFNWADTLKSNPVDFSLIADADGDGYYYPEAYGQHNLPDCDDTDPAVNPGATEIQGNGIDDDCNPDTTDGAVQVTVVKPRGGEVIPSGSTYTIQWVAPSNAVKFDLKYSINNGTTWKKIAVGVPGTSYYWQVPIPTANKTKCLVKVIGYNASGMKVGEDNSDATFTIEVVKVISPNGGEILKSGITWPLTWRTNGTIRPVAKVKLYYSINGGLWNPIGTVKGNPGNYPFRVPLFMSSDTSKVKVVLKDTNGKTVGTDTSDRYFTIQP